MDMQRELVNRIAYITTLLVPDDEGVELRFLNRESKSFNKLSAQQVADIMKETKPSGSTEIGTYLKSRILEPLVYGPLSRSERLKRPLLISVITDGQPEGGNETPETFKNAIVECRERLKANGYKAKCEHISDN